MTTRSPSFKFSVPPAAMLTVSVVSASAARLTLAPSVISRLGRVIDWVKVMLAVPLATSPIPAGSDAMLTAPSAKPIFWIFV